MFATITDDLHKVRFSDTVPFGTTELAAFETNGDMRMKLHVYKRRLTRVAGRTERMILEPVRFTDMYVAPSAWEIVG